MRAVVLLSSEPLQDSACVHYRSFAFLYKLKIVTYRGIIFDVRPSKSFVMSQLVKHCDVMASESIVMSQLVKVLWSLGQSLTARVALQMIDFTLPHQKHLCSHCRDHTPIGYWHKVIHCIYWCHLHTRDHPFHNLHQIDTHVNGQNSLGRKSGSKSATYFQMIAWIGNRRSPGQTNGLVFHITTRHKLCPAHVNGIVTRWGISSKS